MYIKRLVASDSKRFLDLMLKLDVESEFMLYEPGERNTTNSEMSQQIEFVNSSGGIILGAFHNDRILGFVSLSRGSFNRIKHSGYVVIGVTKEASGVGIATELLTNLDDWAHKHEISKLELTVMIHNERAYQLYLKNDYVVEGIKKNSVLVKGRFYDEYFMGKVL